MWKTVGLVAGSLAAGTLMVGSALPVSGAADYDDDTAARLPGPGGPRRRALRGQPAQA